MARAYRAELDKEMSKLEKGAYGALEVTLKGKTTATLPNGEIKTIAGEIKRNLLEGEDSQPYKDHLLNQLRLEASHEEQKAERAQQEQRALGRWNDRTKKEVIATLNRLTSIIDADTPIKSIDKATGRDFKQKYLKLPANMNKKPAYRNKTIAELLAMEIPEGDRLAHNTINNNLIRISVFFKWAADQGYIDKNPFEGLTVGKNKRASEERHPFSKDDLIKLFNSEEQQKGFKHPYQYWIPTIALYTGMRLEEICRLQCHNFKQIDGVDCIEIMPDGDWKGKTSAALRPIPIHPMLHKLALLAYVKHIEASGNSRLFGEIKPVNGEYGAPVSKWFARYATRCGVDELGKVFHSFRHTLANELKQIGIQQVMTEAIMGHESNSMTYGRYGKSYEIKAMFEAIKQADFGLEHVAFE